MVSFMYFYIQIPYKVLIASWPQIVICVNLCFPNKTALIYCLIKWIQLYLFMGYFKYRTIMLILLHIYLQMFQLSFSTRMLTLLSTEIQSPLNVQSPQLPHTPVFTGRGSAMESPRPSPSPTTTNTLDPP